MIRIALAAAFAALVSLCLSDDAQARSRRGDGCHVHKHWHRGHVHKRWHCRAHQRQRGPIKIAEVKPQQQQQRQQALRAVASVPPPVVAAPLPGILGEIAGALGFETPDQYLWRVYERMPRKVDSSGDFTWKDPAAAGKRGLDLPAYVIGGMHPDLREALHAAGRAMDAQGICWSFLSAFRDDYRQKIASGFKAGTCGSMHGGSCRTAGHGDGRAADVWVCGQTSPRQLWAWMDRYGPQFRLSRPMPGNDPAHIQVAGGFQAVAAGLRVQRIKSAVAAYRWRAGRPHPAQAAYAQAVVRPEPEADPGGN